VRGYRPQTLPGADASGTRLYPLKTNRESDGRYAGGLRQVSRGIPLTRKPRLRQAQPFENLAARVYLRRSGA